MPKLCVKFLSLIIPLGAPVTLLSNLTKFNYFNIKIHSTMNQKIHEATICCKTSLLSSSHLEGRKTLSSSSSTPLSC